VRQTIPPNIALVGCGAIARAFYLPALGKYRGEFGRLWLVDSNEDTSALAASMVPGRQAPRFTDVDDDIQLVIVATPNQSHFPLAREALSRGAHVLIEKPFVIWPEEGRSLVEAAAAKNRVVAVNQTRRLFSLTRELRQRINEGTLGRLKSIVHREGTKLAWPFESGAAFSSGVQRTGVIMDFGVHVLDFYHYLLQPVWTLKSAIHDGFQGPEGLAEIEIQADDTPVSIRLSRYHAQENVARMAFERAEVAFNVYDPSTYIIRPVSGGSVRVVTAASPEKNSHANRLLLNFLAASQGRESPVCDAASSLPVIDILDQAYRSARHYPATLGAV
jgi:predicted dehydrogenase